MLRPWQLTIRQRHEPKTPTHAGKLERWLGAETLSQVSSTFRTWYGPPVALGVPGNVYVTAGGEFVGDIAVGNELTQYDMAEAILRRERKRRFAHATRQGGAFASLSALLAARTGGKGCDVYFNKTSVAVATAGGSEDLWLCGTLPAAGSAGAAAPGGTATTNSTTGNWGYVNAVSSANSGHHLGGWIQSSVINQIMVIDQLFRVAKTMSSSTTEAVTGTFARYQNQTATAADYIGGNFCFPSTTTTLAATAHNWTVCQYTNQAGTAAQSFPSAAGLASGTVAKAIDLTAGPGSWFMPLASGDVGVKALTQMQCSVNTITGAIDFVVAHPIGFYPTYVINQIFMIDAVSTAIDQLTNVYDNACISALEVSKPNVGATTYQGKVSFCSE